MSGVTIEFDSESLAPLHDDAARAYLEKHGLPEDHLLFGATQSLGQVRKVDGRDLMVVGEGAESEFFCVDTLTGEVVVLNETDGSLWHVSASPEKFSRCLDEFMARFPYGGEDAELEEREDLANHLADALENIDDTALQEDPGFWRTILGDVAIGDYSED